MSADRVSLGQPVKVLTGEQCCALRKGISSPGGGGAGGHPASRWESGRGYCSRGIEGPDGANGLNPKGTMEAIARVVGVGEQELGQHGLSVRQDLFLVLEAGERGNPYLAPDSGVGDAHLLEQAQGAGPEGMRQTEAGKGSGSLLWFTPAVLACRRQSCQRGRGPSSSLDSSGEEMVKAKTNKDASHLPSASQGPAGQGLAWRPF